ncbi:MAG: hypothetical protein QM796_20345 [Chthoniobacteraceae bacterium]
MEVAAVRELDELRMEYIGLESAVADAEAALANGDPAKHTLLSNFVTNARTQLATLSKKIKDTEEEKRQEETKADEIAVANREKVEKETSLNAQEKETYGKFLAEEFFKKKDLNKLDSFYAHAYDRLTDAGKQEMSHRVWEGIRHDEYKFSELPGHVQEKEEQFAYGKLTKPEITDPDILKIPAQDRTDFVKAYEAGDKKAAAKVLDRDSFKQNMAKDAEPTTKHADVTQGKEQAKIQVATNATASPKTDDLKAKLASTDFSSMDFSKLQLADHSSDNLTAGVQGTGAAKQNAR